MCHSLRHALAGALHIDPAQLVVGNGADGVITQICMAYLDESSEAIASDSSFPNHERYTHIMRARLIKIPLEDYRLDLEAMADAITGRTKLAFICNPNNPTGTIVTASEVEAFMQRVPDHVLVVFDEAYYELVASDEYPDTLAYIRQGRENVIVLRTFSKVYGLAGIRLGYGIAMPGVLAPMNQVKESFAVNRLAQAAGIAALQDQEFLQQTVQANHASRLWLYEQFDRLGLSYLESHTNFVLVHIGTHALEVQQELLKKGVIVRPCDSYDLGDCLRVTVGTPEQDARFIAVLEAALETTGARAPGSPGSVLGI